MKIEGQIVLITGGASGLGAATARHFAAQGAVVAVLDHDLDKALAVAREIDGMAVQADVCDEKAVDQAISTVEAGLGCPRIIIQCAGVAMAARIVEREGQPSFAVFQRTLEINLFGTYHVMSHAARRIMELAPLVEGERGVIINTASVAYEDGQLGQAAYAASKGAVASMTLPAAREFARAGIRVMTIAPGLFQTPMMVALPPAAVAQIEANIPFPARLGDPTEYALLAEHIVNNPYLNGSTIRLDGAVRLPSR